VWADRENVSRYDGLFVALAAALGVPLVTADRRLARAPSPGCAVEPAEAWQTQFGHSRRRPAGRS
jgi:hypothetical protein